MNDSTLVPTPYMMTRKHTAPTTYQANAANIKAASFFGSAKPEPASPFVDFTQAKAVSAIGAASPTSTTPSQNMTARSPANKRSMERDGAWYGAMAIHIT